MPPVHVIRYEGSWRPIAGVRVLRFMARCRCGWASGWVSNRSEAATVAAVHRRRPALASVPVPGIFWYTGTEAADDALSGP